MVFPALLCPGRASLGGQARGHAGRIHQVSAPLPSHGTAQRLQGGVRSCSKQLQQNLTDEHRGIHFPNAMCVGRYFPPWTDGWYHRDHGAETCMEIPKPGEGAGDSGPPLLGTSPGTGRMYLRRFHELYEGHRNT